MSEIAIPATPPDDFPQTGEQDFFCGGHTFLRNGSLLFVNGTDAVNGCLDDPCQVHQPGKNAPYGSQGAWRLNTSSEPLAWVKATTGASKPSPRWYPTALELPDGKPLVLGHTGHPVSPCQVPVAIDALRDEFTMLPTPSWNSAIPNLVVSPCNAAPLRLLDYPRIHLLASGELIWTSALEDIDPDPLVETWMPRRSQFLDLTPDPGICNGEQRWKDGLPQATTVTPHYNGNSVHLITWNHATGQFSELLFGIGGAAMPVEDVALASGAALQSIHGVVERMGLDPTLSPSAVGEWKVAPHVPQLNFSRVNHNAVLLLDGSIVVIGGVGWDPGTSAIVWRRYAEQMMPREVIEATASESWIVLADQAIPRQYHSVAGLLPDGRVVSAGGVNLPPVGEPDYCKPDHTVEIYTPKYTFRGVRPVIDRTLLKDPAVEHYNYATNFTVSVTFESTASFDRLALVRPGASTHAFDSSQLYVELPIQQPAPGGGGLQSISAVMPPNANYAPPGYYLLVAVDNAGRPSAGEWIRLDEPNAP